jgi:hypothetical protein
MGDAERLFRAKYPIVEIEQIRLHASYVIVQEEEPRRRPGAIPCRRRLREILRRK